MRRVRLRRIRSSKRVSLTTFGVLACTALLGFAQCWVGLSVKAVLRQGPVAVASSRPGASPGCKVKSASGRTHVMPTAEAPFLTPTVQPLLLSPDGERTARFEFSEPGIVIRVEAAPSFGSEEAERRAGKQKVERITIIPRAKVGVMGVRDLFWLDGGSFLITGYEGPSGRFYGWIADLRRGKASVIKLPSSEANLFVPLGRSGLPMTRASAESQEVLVGFTVPDGASTNFSWTWCSTLSGDTADAGDGLATSEWREVALSKQGNIDAVLLSNGTVLRRSGDGWLDLGALDLDAAALSASLASQPLLPQEHLVSTTPRGALVIDTAAGGNLPEHHPQAGDLDSDIQRAEDSDLATWVLEQAVLRQTSALVRLSAEKAPQPIFVHPFADVLASGVWINPDTEDVEAVSVQDLKPKTYSLSSEHSRQLQSLRAHLPAEIQLYDVPVATAAMELVSLQTHGERCVAFFAHPLLSDLVALPAVVKAGKFTWLGRSALPTRGAALNSAAAALKPKLEGHRIPSSDGTSVPAYLLVPSQGAGALVVRLHDGPDLRDSWGTDSFDAWLLSRGYGILKVNYRGSAGFGRAWRASRGFAEDIASAIEWAVAERKVLGAARAEAGAAGGVPPVALVGSYFGGYAALHTASRLREWAACVVAIAPLQAAPGGVWSEPYIPRAESQGNLEPATLVGDLQGMAMMLVEYECDDSNGPLAAKLIPVGCDPEEWPTSVQYVQYAGERKGGGVVRQNMLDLYRRMDSFLHAELSERAGPRGLLREDFVDEVPFLSAALLPATAGSSSASGESIEIGLERVLRQSKGDDIADALPELRSAFGTPAGVGFSAEGTAAKQFGKRLQHMLVAPASRVVVREDGTIEVTVSFTEAPQKLHVLLSEVWMHIRAEGLGFTLALPRQPKRGQRIQAFALPSGTGFHFEIPGEANVGAVENFNYWAARGSSLLDLVLPEDLTAAAVLVPTVST